MGLDFVALMTGTEIRQALDVLELRSEADTSPEAAQAIATVRARVEELETRLNTARRSAWVAVSIAWSEVMPGDTIVAKDGALLQVIDGGRGEAWLEVSDMTGDRQLKTADLDRPVPVLRRPTADALDILTRQLGAQATT